MNDGDRKRHAPEAEVVADLTEFVWLALRSNADAARTPGFRAGQLLTDRNLTFWTLTAWDDEDALKRFMLAGNHAKAMPKLILWCDEASVARWAHEGPALPSWDDANAHLHEFGRASRVRFPSPRHNDLAFPPPRVGLVQEIKKKSAAAKSA